MKRGCLDVEVIEWPVAVSGVCSSSNGRWDKRLFVEAKYAELVSDKVQTSKEEGLGGTKTRGAHIPASGSVGNSSEPKRIVSLEPAMPKMVERWAIR